VTYDSRKALPGFLFICIDGSPPMDINMPSKPWTTVLCPGGGEGHQDYRDATIIK
jgi:hypothetical protein